MLFGHRNIIVSKVSRRNLQLELIKAPNPPPHGAVFGQGQYFWIANADMSQSPIERTPPKLTAFQVNSDFDLRSRL